MAAVGLAQNMAALRALGSVGIQKGHMALQRPLGGRVCRRKGSAVEEVARALIAAGEIKLHRAQEILAQARRAEAGRRKLNVTPDRQQPGAGAARAAPPRSSPNTPRWPSRA